MGSAGKDSAHFAPTHRFVGLLLSEEASLLNIAGPSEAFLMTERELVRHGPDPRLPAPLKPVAISPAGGSVRTSSGIIIETLSIAQAETIAFDTVAVVGGIAVERLAHDGEALRWLCDQSLRANRMAAFGSGTFVLARAGLLDGKRCAVHWRVAEQVQRAAPLAKVEAEALFVRDGRLLTAAGSVASLDLALKMIEDDFGRLITVMVARLLVLARVRSGEQPQIGVELQAQMAVTPKVLAAADWIVNNLDRPLSLAMIAQRFAMTERNLCRVFQKELGTSPHRFIEQVRVESARRWIADTSLPIEKVARRCGFSSGRQLNQSFKRVMGETPASYRNSLQL